MDAELVATYEAELAELTFNSKPIITTLTMIAGESPSACASIVRVIENRIRNAPVKLPLMYLMDSIVKNIQGPYVPEFSRNLVETFSSVYASSDNNVRRDLRHLLDTWMNVFPAITVRTIEGRIRNLDNQGGNYTGRQQIHVNPKVLPQYQQQNRSEPRGRMGQPPPPPRNQQHHAMPPMHQGRKREATGMHDNNMMQPPYPGNNEGKRPRLEQQHQQQQQPYIYGAPPQNQGNMGQQQPVMPNNNIPAGGGYNNGNISDEQLQQTVANLQYVMSQLPPNEVPASVHQQIQQIQAQINLGIPPPVQRQPPAANPYAGGNMMQGQPMMQQPQMVPGGAGMMAPQYVNNMNPSNPPGGVYGMRPQVPQNFVASSLGMSSQPTKIPVSSAPAVAILQSLAKTATSPANMPPPATLVEPQISFSSSGSLSQHNPVAVKDLYDNIPHQCQNQCGRRFRDKADLRKHLDWHFAQNKAIREKKAMSRSWFPTEEEWFSLDIKNLGLAEMPTPSFFDMVSKKGGDQPHPSPRTPAMNRSVTIEEAGQDHCSVCYEEFEKIFDDNAEVWRYRGATKTDGGEVLHFKCLEPKEDANDVPTLESAPDSKPVAAF